MISEPITNKDSGVGSVRARLDSWKEIATYLKRGSRTVRRWERQEGLPVHRHQHGKRATIYGFPDEIDKWLESRSRDEGADQAPLSHALLRSTKPSTEQQKPHRIGTAVIAILPLRSISDDPEQQRFADGLTEELIAGVGYSNPDRLRVIALTSVMQYKQSPKSIAQIGQELGADYILEGGIRRYGRRVRLTARLIATWDQAHVWADQYEIQLPPIFSLQQAMALQVAQSLSAVLHVAPTGRLNLPSPRSSEAHDAYLEARSHFLPTAGDTTKRIEQLNIAIERDRKFAPSYAELALVYFRRLTWDYPPVVTFKRIRENAAQALKLDPKLSRAHSMLAAFYLFSAWAWSKAERSSRRAIKLNPSDPWARIVRAAYHLVIGEPHQAIEDLRLLRQLDPQCLETGMWFACLAYFARRHDLAIAHSREILQLDPSSAAAHMILGLNLAQLDEDALALDHCEKARELGDSSISQLSMACSIYALVGERQSAERLFQELLAAKEKQYTRFIFLAHAAACLGKDQQTLEWLEKAYEQRDSLLVFLRAGPAFDPLLGVSGFRNLLRRIGLPEASNRLALTQRAYAG